MIKRVRHPSQLPGYLEADAHAALIRTVAFQNLTERIGGFEVLPMTLNHYARLRLIESPFLPPFGTPHPVDLAAFLWVLHPRFTVRNSWPKWRHFRRCRKFSYDLGLESALVHGAREFVREALIDRPPIEDSQAQKKERNYFSDECSIVAMLAREYHWSETSIINLPLKRTFQYLKEISAHHQAAIGRKPILWNPSDVINNEYLEAINRKN